MREFMEATGAMSYWRWKEHKLKKELFEKYEKLGLWVALLLNFYQIPFPLFQYSLNLVIKCVDISQIDNLQMGILKYDF